MAYLATLDEFKTYAGLKNPENDERNEAILANVSSLIKTYCGRTFVDYISDDFEEYFDGGADYLYLKEFPILNIGSVEYSADYGITYTELGNNLEGWVQDRRNERIFIAPSYRTSGPNTIKVTYTGGYESGAPMDLKLAVFDMMQMYLKAETTPKKTQGFTSVEFIKTADFPSHIKRVLDLYRVL